LPRCRSLIPGRVNTHGLTPDEMILPDAVNGQDGPMVHGVVAQRYGRKEGNPPGCRGEGRQTSVARYVLVMITKLAADLPLAHRIHQ
jgi:hypothetical protein